MADIRETVLLDHMDTSRFRLKSTTGFMARMKLRLRRFVVATSGTPLRHLYVAIYRAHVTYAVRKLRDLPGIHSIYITGGMALDELEPGISDIDLTVNCEGDDEQQARVTAALKHLGEQSPLYDTLISQCAQSLTALQSLYKSDFYFQYLFDCGRTRWKLLYGEDVFALLPAVREDRIGGGYYMLLRAYWSHCIKSSFGFSPTATDELFRTSIAYKVVANALNCQAYFEGRTPVSSRKAMMQAALESTTGEEHNFIQRLIASAASRHLRFEGDIQEEAFHFLMPRLEALHRALSNNSTFQGIAVNGTHIDASANEMLISPRARGFVDEVIARVKQQWTGYRAAYLVPSLSFFYPDDLVLLLEAHPDRLPTVRQIRDLCRFALDNPATRTQRVALFLLLPEAAYQLELVSVIEQWHHTLCPLANPEVFALLSRSEFVVDGQPRAETSNPVWTRFANDLINEELGIRRKAFSKVAQAGDVGSLELLRNLWRQLQLEIVERSVAQGFAVLPMTVASIERMLQQFGLPGAAILHRLREAYQSEINGQPVDIRPLLPELMALFAAFTEAANAVAR
jgi:hypothetical protein